MVSESIPLLQLMQTKGIGPRSVARVLDLLEQGEMSLHEFVAMAPAEMVGRFGLKTDQARSIQANEENAAQLAELLEMHNVRTALRGNSLYPERLRTVLGDKAPPVLFVAGTPELLHRRGVGFCGARDASPKRDDGARDDLAAERTTVLNVPGGFRQARPPALRPAARSWP